MFYIRVFKRLYNVVYGGIQHYPMAMSINYDYYLSFDPKTKESGATATIRSSLGVGS